MKHPLPEKIDLEITLEDRPANQEARKINSLIDYLAEREEVKCGNKRNVDGGVWICTTRKGACPLHNEKKSESWEERFDKEIMQEPHCAYPTCNYRVMNPKNIKSFITSELAAQREMIMEELYEEKEKFYGPRAWGISDAINVVKNIEK